MRISGIMYAQTSEAVFNAVSRILTLRMSVIMLIKQNGVLKKTHLHTPAASKLYDAENGLSLH